MLLPTLKVVMALLDIKTGHLNVIIPCSLILVLFLLFYVDPSPWSCTSAQIPHGCVHTGPHTGPSPQTQSDPCSARGSCPSAPPRRSPSGSPAAHGAPVVN